MEDLDPTHWRGHEDPLVASQNIEVRPLTFPGRPGRKSISGLEQSGFSHPFDKYETKVGSEPGPKRKAIGAVLGPYSLWIMRLVEPVVKMDPLRIDYGSLLVWNSARTRSWSPYVTIKFLVSTSCRVVKKWGWFTSRSVKSKHNVFPLKKCDQEPVRWLFWLFWVHRDSHTMPYPTYPMPYPPAPAPRSSRCRIVDNAPSLVRLVRAPDQATAEIRLINVIQHDTTQENRV